MNTTVLEVNVALKTESAWPIRNPASIHPCCIGSPGFTQSAIERAESAGSAAQSSMPSSFSPRRAYWSRMIPTSDSFCFRFTARQASPSAASPASGANSANRDRSTGQSGPIGEIGGIRPR